MSSSIHINPYVTNGFSYPYHLDEYSFICRGIRSRFLFSFYFSMKFKVANRIVLDGTPRFAASHLVIFCLPMSHKKDARLIWVKDYLVHYKGLIFVLAFNSLCCLFEVSFVAIFILYILKE